MNTRFVLLAAALLGFPIASLAQLKVLASGGFAAPLEELLPRFEKSAGITVTTARGPSQGNGPDTIPAQLRRGVAADVVIMSREGLNDLIAESRIVPGSDTDLAQTVLGVAVRTGANKPDLRTLEAFKQMVLRARSINLPSTTKIYMTQEVFPRLGILEQVSPKITDAGLDAVASGTVEISIRPVSEILHVPGVGLAGTIPPEIQRAAVFSAAIVRDAAHPDAAKRLIVFLTSAEAHGVLGNHGMKPPKSR